MRPISLTELKELARQLPQASEARGNRFSVMRRCEIRPYAYTDKIGAYDYHCSKVDFECHHGSLDGTMVYYWTFRDLIVRVDV